MAPLPHWDNSQASNRYWEPVFLNQFRVVITPPAAVTEGVDLLVEQVLTVSGLPEFLTQGTTVQYYKFSKRAYANGTPNDTLTNLDMTFEVNLNDENNMYVYNTLRAWSDLIYDPLTGRQGLKKDYVGQIAVDVFNKAGDIFREYKFPVSFIREPFNAMSLDYTKNDFYKLTAKFVCDVYRETRTGQIEV